jgi:hypothetical protein
MGPFLQYPEVDQETLFIQFGSADGNLNQEVMTVEFLAPASDFF